MSKVIVSKFGGSSVKDAKAMLRCVDIVKSNCDIKIVILSATYNTTNMLEQLANFSSQGREEKTNEVLQKIMKQHLNIASELNVESNVIEELNYLFNEAKLLSKNLIMTLDLTPEIMDSVYSIGERMSSLLFTYAIQKEFNDERKVTLVDARDIIKTNSKFKRAIPDIKLIEEECGEVLIPSLNENELIVTQGFIGADSQGRTTTLGREGSDFSAALLAEAINADILQIWTDVPGIATTDPRLIKDAKFISEISYKEASALAHLGAKILFPKTMLPAMRKDIPIFVSSSIDPSLGATWIRHHNQLKCLPDMRALSIIPSQQQLICYNSNILSCFDFFNYVVSALNDCNIIYDFISLAGNKLTLILDGSTCLSADVINKIQKYSDVETRSDLSLVSIVGNNVSSATKLQSEILNDIYNSKIEFLSHMSDSMSLTFVVTDRDASKFLNLLHNKII